MDSSGRARVLRRSGATLFLCLRACLTCAYRWHTREYHGMVPRVRSLNLRLVCSCVCVCVGGPGLMSKRSPARPFPFQVPSTLRPREGTFRPIARNMTLRDHSEKERSMLAACFRRMRSSSSLTEIDIALRRALCSATRRYGFRRMSTSSGSIGASARSVPSKGTVLSSCSLLESSAFGTSTFCSLTSGLF